MAPRLDIEHITETLVAAVEARSDEAMRLRRGQLLRAEMHQAVQAGEEYTGYRLKWLRETANTLAQILGGVAEDFDKAHPDDLCSAHDLLDVLQATSNIIAAVVAGAQPPSA